MISLSVLRVKSRKLSQSPQLTPSSSPLSHQCVTRLFVAPRGGRPHPHADPARPERRPGPGRGPGACAADRQTPDNLRLRVPAESAISRRPRAARARDRSSDGEFHQKERPDVRASTARETYSRPTLRSACCRSTQKDPFAATTHKSHLMSVLLGMQVCRGDGKG